MTATLTDLLLTYFTVLAGLPFFLAPGYLFGTLTDVFGFRARSAQERAVWSVALSMPLAVVFTPLLGRYIGLRGSLACFLAVSLLAGWKLLRDRGAQRNGGESGSVRLSYSRVAWVCFAVALLLPLTTLDIQSGHRLFVSTVSYDWAVRVPLVRAAITGAVPPTNPLSALNAGIVTPLRYYYFWYVLVAQWARLVHVDARIALQASTVWAALDFLGVLFLCLKYFLGIRARFEAACLTAMFTGCVMGLDLIPAMATLALPVGMNIEMEWWHPDRSPSWLSTFAYAPHHIACIATAMIGFVAVVVGTASRNDETRKSLGPSVATYGCFAGCCFGAAAGASTFVALIFALACVLWLVRSLLLRQWRAVAVLALAGLMAVALDVAFLREMTSPTGPQAATMSSVQSTGPPATEPLLHFSVRNADFARSQLALHLHGRHQKLAKLATQWQCCCSSSQSSAFLGLCFSCVCAMISPDEKRFPMGNKHFGSSSSRLQSSRCL